METTTTTDMFGEGGRMPEVRAALLDADRRALSGEPAVPLDEDRERIARRIAEWGVEGVIGGKALREGSAGPCDGGPQEAGE